MGTQISVNVTTPQSVFAAQNKGRQLMNPYTAPGKARITYFYYKNETGGTLADGTVINFGPLLRSTRHLPMVLLKNSALGASRLLNLGYQGHATRDGVAVNGAIKGILPDHDAAAAKTVFTWVGTAAGVNIEGDAVDLLGQVTGGTIPNEAVIEGYLISFNPF
jgi:hypothetical protein